MNKTVNRRHPVVAVAMLLLLVAGVVVAAPAPATLREGFEIGPGQSIDKDYPRLVGANPQNEVEPGPSECRTVTFCDTIPFVVHAPENLGEDDSFYVAFEVSWTDPSKANDVDVFIFDTGQLKGGATSRMGKATTSSNPEKASLQQPTLGEYQLVVMNVNGVNNGYKVKAKMVQGKFESAVEQLAPPRNPPPSAKEDEDTGPPPESTEPPAASGGGDSTPVTLAPVPVGADSDFDFGSSDFDDQLSAPEVPQFSGGGAPAGRAAPQDVSGMVLVLWFVVVPLLGLGAAAAVVFRRRRNLLLAT